MEYRYEDRDTVEKIPPIQQPVFSAKYNAEELPQAIVRLKFMEGATKQAGTGFFTNIPGAKKSFVITAGHNLISEEPYIGLKVQLFKSKDYIDIPNDYVRINSVYVANPKECSAEYDYGVILLFSKIIIPGDFGFSLLLGVADRLDCQLSVTGYPGTENAVMITSSGLAVNPIMRENQLEYIIETEAGLSGSPVWVGYKGHPTVVAIHNYGRKINKPGYGSKGTRINLKSLRDIFTWTGVDTTERMLRASSTRECVEPPLHLAYSPDDGAFRIIVDDTVSLPETMLMSIFPVYAAPSHEKKTPPAFGFMQKDEDGIQRWVSWNVPSTASLVDDLRRAWLGRIEVQGGSVKQGKKFAILVPAPFGTIGSAVGTQALVVNYVKVGDWLLQMQGEVLDIIGYERHLKGRPSKGA